MDFVETLHGGEFIIAELGALSRDSALVAAGLQLAAGTVVAFDDDGRLIAYPGSGACAGVLFYPVDTREGGAKAGAYIARRAKVRLDLLTYPDGLAATTAAALNAKTIVVSSSSLIADTGGGGGGYAASAVHFDGTAQFILDAASGSDSPFIAFSFWAKTVPSSVSNFLPWAFWEDAFNRAIYPNFANTSDFSIGLAAENAPETRFLTLDTPQDGTFPVWQNSTWINFRGSIDTNHLSGQKIFSAFLNAVQQTFTRYQDDDEFDMAFGGFPFRVPGQVVSGKAFDMCDLWVAPGQFVDWTDPAMSAKVRDPITGKPVDLGTNGELVTGVAPAFYLTGDADEWVARATALGFTTSGTLTNATTSPSD